MGPFDPHGRILSNCWFRVQMEKFSIRWAGFKVSLRCPGGWGNASRCEEIHFLLEQFNVK